jgi:hypothetical protein
MLVCMAFFVLKNWHLTNEYKSMKTMFCPIIMNTIIKIIR